MVLKDMEQQEKQPKKEIEKEEKPFYKKPWFWAFITLIIMSISRPHVTVVCGNGNDNRGSCK